ncbi:endogenous retrovirus group K member 9 Gag poly KAT6A-like, partial [Sigmodon hispidus]
YDLTWNDLYVIQASVLTPKEGGQVQAAARHYADQTDLMDNMVPVGDMAAPAAKPTGTTNQVKMATREENSWFFASFT